MFRKDLRISGLRLVKTWEALIRDPQGLFLAASVCSCLAGRGRKNKTEGLQYPMHRKSRDSCLVFRDS